MAEAAKHLPINGGHFITDLKRLFSLVKTRRTMAFAYGFMFAFVLFTVFLAFNPSQNSSPWFTNVFSASTTSADSYRSQFSSLFSYFFPGNNPPQQAQNFTSLSTQTNLTRSNNTQSLSLSQNGALPIGQNHTQSIGSSNKPTVLQPNQTTIPPTVNKQTPTVKNQTQSKENSDKVQVLKANQTTVTAPKSPESKNQNQTEVTAPRAPDSKNQSVSAPNLGKENSGKGEKGVVEKKGVVSNYTSSLSKKQSNGTGTAVSAKQGIENLIRSLVNCDLFDGEWVMDDSYPLYKPGSCSFIDEQFNCILNGRPDKDFQKFKWKPRGCTLPRLNGAHMLELLRGKRLVFVGDSLNRNMWESLVCILRNSAKDQKKVYEAHGRHHFRGEASYSFIFKDYNCSVEFFVSPFLVQEWEMSDRNGTKKETLRLDLVGRSSDQYKNADIIIFNTGHWWTHEKTSKGKDYYQEGSHVYGELNVLEAFRKALTTWARWVDANMNPMKSLIFFRGYSASHFSGGQWNSGGACDSEIEPIKNDTFLREYPPKMTVLEKVLRGMKTHVTYLNITQMTDYRKDGHPSIYRKQSLSKEERRSPLMYQDCSHWCLPGVPDAWNELLYAGLLVKESKMLQHQRRT